MNDDLMHSLIWYGSLIGFIMICVGAIVRVFSFREVYMKAGRYIIIAGSLCIVLPFVFFMCVYIPWYSVMAGLWVVCTGVAVSIIAMFVKDADYRWIVSRAGRRILIAGLVFIVLSVVVGVCMRL